MLISLIIQITLQLTFVWLNLLLSTSIFLHFLPLQSLLLPFQTFIILRFFHIGFLFRNFKFKSLQINADQHFQRKQENKEVDYWCTVDIFSAHLYKLYINQSSFISCINSYIKFSFLGKTDFVCTCLRHKGQLLFFYSQLYIHKLLLFSFTCEKHVCNLILFLHVNCWGILCKFYHNLRNKLFQIYY